MRWCCGVQSSKRLRSLVLSATLFVASVCPIAAANPQRLSDITSTITIVQTIYATEAAAIATATASATTDEHSYTDDTVFRNTVLNISNTIRQNFNASALVWNDTLAEYAQSWSEICKFEHSKGPYGENFAAAYPSASAAVTAWANESQHFNFSDPDLAERTGNFSQMVWKSTTAMGCGRKNCDRSSGNGDEDNADGWYVVCSYWPRGNILGELAANVDAAMDASESDWDDDGMIGKNKSGAGRLREWSILFGVQVLALMGWIFV